MRSRFIFFRNVRQFISNSNSSNTKYFYDLPISNSSNTPISNYFLTVRTKEEFTVYFQNTLSKIKKETFLCFFEKKNPGFHTVKKHNPSLLLETNKKAWPEGKKKKKQPSSQENQMVGPLKWFNMPNSQNQNCVLVTCQNDNHSPGPGRLVPSSYQRSELSNTILRTFSREDKRVWKCIPIPNGLGQKATLTNFNMLWNYKAKNYLKCRLKKMVVPFEHIIIMMMSYQKMMMAYLWFGAFSFWVGPAQALWQDLHHSWFIEGFWKRDNSLHVWFAAVATVTTAFSPKAPLALSFILLRNHY